MDMGVLTRFNIGNHFAHVDAVFPHGVACIHIFECHFVADRNVLFGGDVDSFILVHDPAGHGRACF